jgi:hypothetical protein
MSYVHMIGVGVSNAQGDLTRRGMERYMFAINVNTINCDRFAFEDFWIALARMTCIGPGCWDMGEEWALKKLGEPDELSIYYYTSGKAHNIGRLAGESSPTMYHSLADQADQFMRERAEILRKPKRVANRAGKNIDVSWEDIMDPTTKKNQRPFRFTKLHESHFPKTKDIYRKGANIATPRSHLPPGVSDANQGRVMPAPQNNFPSEMVLRVPVAVS